jgi:hypothetical protein
MVYELQASLAYEREDREPGADKTTCVFPLGCAIPVRQEKQ